MPSITGGTAGPSEARGSTSNAAIDGSGWNIVFGQNNRLESSREEAQALAPYMQYIIIGAGLLLAWRLLKRN